MPYQGEKANKASHRDLVRNPEVQEFLRECDYITEPSDEQIGALGSIYQAPPSSSATLPDGVIAVDGSYYESSLNERYPSTKVAYAKVGSIYINMVDFHSLRPEGNRLVDPFRVARLQDNHDALTFALPSANIRIRGYDSVRDGFRAAVDSYLSSPKTRFRADDPRTSLRTTLFRLASRRPGDMGTDDDDTLRLHSCPRCKAEGPFTIRDQAEPQKCPSCGGPLFASDCLRLWEEVSDFQSNLVAVSRFTQVLEHLLPMHYIRYIAEQSLQSLGTMAFFIDGPLAIFGTPAWLHASILRYLWLVNAQLESAGLANVLMVGLQKTGQLVDHLCSIGRFLPENRIAAVSDEYRYKYICASREPSSNGFGAETYYGQDFLYKTPSGREFVFAVPYPVSSKSTLVDFVTEKTDIARYANLARAIALINHFESDLYSNAVIPVALAHRYTAISLVPGGRVLDLLTKKELVDKRTQ